MPPLAFGECPADLKEGISSLIFAAPRSSDIPELLAIQNVFEKKYGKDFVSAATDLRPNCGVNRLLIEKLSVRTPTGEVKLKIMKEIAKEYKVEWDTTESEMELLKLPDELIEGPNNFVSATNLPMTPIPKQSVELNKPKTRNAVHFESTASAAEAAAESAKKAIAAAEAAAYLAGKDSNHSTQSSSFYTSLSGSSIDNKSGIPFVNSAGNFVSTDSQTHSANLGGQSEVSKRLMRRSFEKSHYLSDEDGETIPTFADSREIYRRHSYNVASAHSDIKFDESDCDDKIEMEETPGVLNLPPNPAAPQVPSTHVKKDPVPRVHPKLPDYDALAARFEALKYRRSKT